MGQGNIRHRENNDKARPKGERKKNLINKKSNKSHINRVDKESTSIVTHTHKHMTHITKFIK